MEGVSDELRVIMRTRRHLAPNVADAFSIDSSATFQNLLAMENHALDMPWWQDLVTGFDKPIINKGYIKVPETPGLGVALNDDELKKHVKPGTGYFEPTPMWDEVQSWDDALFS